MLGFRVWDKHKKIFVNTWKNDFTWWCAPDGSAWYYDDTECFEADHSNYIFMQSMGALDDLENEVFEGDILGVYVTDLEELEESKTYYLVIEPIDFYLNFFGKKNVDKMFFVDGNRYENPELLSLLSE